MKYYAGNINANFHDNVMPKESSDPICVSAKLMDSFSKMD